MNSPLSTIPTIIVTGGAGFIGSAVCRYLVSMKLANVVNFDALTYAANLDSLKPIENDALYTFIKGDIRDAEVITQVFEEHQPDGVIHLAAESHVDRSISGAADFIQTNVVGTLNVLEAAKIHWLKLEENRRETFKFLHVSTDEVYGSLGDDGLFTEETAYDPSSPYSASKAASDHLTMAWHKTYGLPVVISNCSNNYGPYQFPEKLIPLTIINCLTQQPIPVYGNGKNVRDWLHVNDHANALYLLWKNGRSGEKYNVGGNNEKQNIDVVRTICQLVDQYGSQSMEGGHESLITYVEDRLGHDTRYAIDATKIEHELGWQASENFNSNLQKTVQWYIENQEWWRPMI